MKEELKEVLSKELPLEALQPIPGKPYLTSIKGIYVTERFNEVFGVGGWRVKVEFVERKEDAVVVKVIFEVPEKNIYYECYGGNNNKDLGDAYKGATTDALTKIGSYLGVGLEVFKGKVSLISNDDLKRKINNYKTTKDYQELKGYTLKEDQKEFVAAQFNKLKK
jgi:hypothetical protein|nr:MAG TPA: hypothetical protein [Caudoviricetes sp.]